MNIGDRVRRLRTEKQITQAQLAGTFMTRNMLCQIEKGRAAPSMETLSYLAGALGVSVSCLTADDAELLAYKKAQFLPSVKKKFRQKHFDDALEQLRSAFSDEEQDDEILLLSAHCLIGGAQERFYSGSLSSAAGLAIEAVALLDRCLYPAPHLRTRAVLLTAVGRNPQSPRFELDEELYKNLADDCTAQQFYRYICDATPDSFTDPFYARHMQAKQLIRQNRFHDALDLLRTLEEEKSKRKTGAYTLYRIYTDLETCYRELRDFENAYRYTNKRQSLLNAFRG